MKLNGNIRLFNISIGLFVCQKIYNHLFLNIHNIPLKHNFPYWDFEAVGMVEEFQEGHGDWSCSISNSCLVAIENCGPGRGRYGAPSIMSSLGKSPPEPWAPPDQACLPPGPQIPPTLLSSEAPALA